MVPDDIRTADNLGSSILGDTPKCPVLWSPFLTWRGVTPLLSFRVSASSVVVEARIAPSEISGLL